MTVELSSGTLASIVSMTVAIAILFRRPRRPLYIVFAIFSVALFLWHAASVTRSFGLPWIVVDTIRRATALMIPPTASLFFNELLRDQTMARRNFTRVYFVLSFLLIALDVSPWGDIMVSRIVIATYVFATMALLMYALWLRARSGSSEPERKRISYVFYGGVITLGLAVGEAVPRAELLAAMSHIAATIYLYFLYQSIIARRLIDIVEFLGKAAVFAVLTVVLASVYAILVLWVGKDKQSLGLFNTVVASFVILIIYDQVRPWVEELTVKLLFRERYELQQTVQRLARGLRTVIRLEQMRERVLDTLHDSGRAGMVALYLADEGELAFQLFGYRGAQPPRFLSLTQQPTLLQELRRERRPVLLEQLTERYDDLPTLLTGGDASVQREIERTAEAIASMHLLGANAILPMLVEDRVVGLLVIGSEQVTAPYSTEELASLISIAEACAVVIESSTEFEKRQQRDRLVAIGEMAAGMAHEIRNPLGAIKGAAQCLDPAQLPKDATEFVDVIIEEVDRLNNVLAQFLEYAKPYRGNPVPTDVNKVVAATVRLLARDQVPVSVSVQQDLAHDLPQVLLDPEQLKQVLINLLQNAIHAMPQGGQIFVSTGSSGAMNQGDPTLSSHAGGRRAVYVRVRDTGSGIAREDIARIFVPFFATKAGGTGLGLAISQRIIENAGGRIEVSSRKGEGTSFTVRLPLLGDGAVPRDFDTNDATGPELASA